MPVFRNAMEACVEQFHPRMWNAPRLAISSARILSKPRTSAPETRTSKMVDVVPVACTIAASTVNVPAETNGGHGPDTVAREPIL